MLSKVPLLAITFQDSKEPVGFRKVLGEIAARSPLIAEANIATINPSCQCLVTLHYLAFSKHVRHYLGVVSCLVSNDIRHFVLFASEDGYDFFVCVHRSSLVDDGVTTFAKEKSRTIYYDATVPAEKRNRRSDINLSKGYCLDLYR